MQNEQSYIRYQYTSPSFLQGYFKKKLEFNCIQRQNNETNQDCTEIPRPHVLGRVNPEAPHAEPNEVVEVSGNHVADVVFAVVEIVQAPQVAVPHVVGVLKHPNEDMHHIALYAQSGSKKSVAQRELYIFAIYS